jgi:PASTA domain-containing protein
MSDEQEQRRGPAGREPRPDETRLDQSPTAGNQPDDGPRPGDAWVGDRTEQMPGVPAADEDATVLTPRAPQQDETSVMPPVRDWAAENSAWAGRAEVRPPRPGDADYLTGSDWDVTPPDEPRGKWWMPILVGIVGLILLGLLGWGIYLIAQDSGDETPAPATSPPAPIVTTEPTTTTAATTAPTTTPPTTEPTESTNPAEITVPALVGLSRADAQEALQRRGLRFRVISQPSDATPGNVIDSDPAEGQKVPADAVVTLVIAAPRTTAPTTTPTATGPGEPVAED